MVRTKRERATNSRKDSKKLHVKLILIIVIILVVFFVLYMKFFPYKENVILSPNSDTVNLANKKCHVCIYDSSFKGACALYKTFCKLLGYDECFIFPEGTSWNIIEQKLNNAQCDFSVSAVIKIHHSNPTQTSQLCNNMVVCATLGIPVYKDLCCCTAGNFANIQKCIDQFLAAAAAIDYCGELTVTANQCTGMINTAGKPGIPPNAGTPISIHFCGTSYTISGGACDFGQACSPYLNNQVAYCGVNFDECKKCVGGIWKKVGIAECQKVHGKPPFPK